MEDFYNVRRLALILAVQAEIEGMKVENMQCAQTNHTPRYLSEEFMTKARDLQNLAYAHNEQL